MEHNIKSISISRRKTYSRVVFLSVCTLSAVTSILLVAIIGDVLWKSLGVEQLVIFKIANGIVGTCLMLFVASLAAIPIGIMSGICLSEYRHSKVAAAVSYLTDMLQGTPSIIIGIVIYIWVVVPMHGYSAFAGSMALMVMMLPLIIRSTEETMNALPKTLKESGLALGGGYCRVMLKVILPASLGSILTGILLAVSRVAGETAPLMFTALGSMTLTWDMTRPMSAVPLLIWDFYNDPSQQDLVWGTSLFLLLFVLCLNLLTKRLEKKWKK